MTLKQNDSTYIYHDISECIKDRKDLPDVFVVTADQMPQLIKQNLVAPASGIFAKNLASEHTSEALAAVRYNNTAYAFPKSVDNCILYYDKRIFSDESNMKNLDDIIRIAGENHTNVYMDFGNTYYSTFFYLSAGMKLQYKDGKQISMFDSKEGMNAVKALCRIAGKAGNGFIGTDSGLGDNAAIKDGWQSGRIAAAVTGPWNEPVIRKIVGEENLGAVKLPEVWIDGEYRQHFYC